ncbi:hypothetical protein [Sphingosinicella sp. YJ22]|uniref:hypothetical protein n=1 Tax=Sphingosinicella sp. YJ22 TaxID=1104780 RepID=UPI00140AB999|nr:hypothetical protein [Sphingosinicella sp. YJ22]
MGLACAAGAVGLGILYLALAGAPARHIAINLAALAVGLAAYATIVMPKWQLRRAEGAVLPALGLALVATALLGTPVEGAARWVPLGPLNLQVSLIVIPAMVVLFARRPDAAGTVGVTIAALGLALQPDRGMAGALAAGIAAVALSRREPWVLIALVVAAAGLIATLLQADNLPAMPWVDQVFYSSFDVQPVAGLAVVAGSVLLLIPAVAGAPQRSVGLAFGAVWLAILAAAALGNYPTPLVGYGGSAIVGYLLSLSLMSRAFRAEGREAASRLSSTDKSDDRSLSARLT